MLLSPPFLPARGNLSEDDWLAAAMPAEASGEGLFPVGARFEWHGGVHLTAPAATPGGTMQNIRAIADGTVVFARQRTDAQSPDDPLNYGGGYTSNGTVVIRHDTEIGFDAHGAAVTVRFYSVYQHLHTIKPAIVVGRTIYRKAEIGQAGHIYGQPNKFHFEICCDDTNLQHLVGRSSGTLTVTTDGRTDVLFGESYLLVPAGEPIYPSKPLPNYTAAMTSVSPAHRGGLTTTAALQPSGMTGEPLVIGLRYANGAGTAGHQGDVTVTSYRPSGTLVGTALVEADFEYQLFQTVKKISESYPETGRPIPSAVYELLRFGRVVGPDALAPLDVPHWREISHAGGRGWINLNKATIHRFTDADFPAWAGWQLADDDTDGDSRCDSAIVQAAVYGSGSSTQTASLDQTATLLRTAPVRSRLRKLIAKFPSEWDASTIEQRWGWLQTATLQNPQPLDSPNFARFKAHAQALCFALPELFAAQWCFDPREFIRHFRRSSWLSLNELTQMMPRRVGPATGVGSVVGWGIARSRFSPYAVSLNKVLRRYGFISAARRTHLLAQTYTETAMWRTMKEFGEGHPDHRRDGSEYWAAPAKQYYAVFYGRGMMQLTWAGNYEEYGKFRALPSSSTQTYQDARITPTSTYYFADPRDRAGNVVATARQWAPRYDPEIIATDSFNACDSGAFYWISKNTGHGELNIDRVSDLGVTEAAVGRVSVLVNGGGYGFAERQSFAPYIKRYIDDDADSAADTSFDVAHGRNTYHVHVDFTPQRP
jgi:predicted chitinase